MEENSQEKRYDYYRQMDKLIIEEAPVIPLYYDEAVRFVQPYVKNLEVNPMNLLVLKRIKIDEVK